MDKITPDKRSRNMSNIRSKNTTPEIIIRKMLTSLGYRYMLHLKTLHGNPDICFIKRKKVIFINGCFWHQHNDTKCKDSHIPKSNLDYWVPKLKKHQKEIKKT